MKLRSIALVTVLFMAGHRAAMAGGGKSNRGTAHEEPQITPLLSTFLGDFQRNHDGNRAPDRLSIRWKTRLGSGLTFFQQRNHLMSGAGWHQHAILAGGMISTRHLHVSAWLFDKRSTAPGANNPHRSPARQTLPPIRC